MSSVNPAKSRVRRASRAPLGKSLSVDETVLSNHTTQSAAFGRPSSMLARVSSASSGVTSNANASGLTQKVKSASFGSSGAASVSSKLSGPNAVSNAAPRRVLGDLSNTTKSLDQRSSKDALNKVNGTKVRSTSSLSSKPIIAKGPATHTSAVPVAAHSRSTSAASRLSAKSSQSSLSAVTENATAPAAGHRRHRTQSDNVIAPGAPRIGSGNWASTQHTAGEEEEVLDTVLEGDSYSGPDRQGLGIEVDVEQDDLMDHVDDQNELPDVSTDTFELDLDQAFNEDAKVSFPRDGAMHIDNGSERQLSPDHDLETRDTQQSSKRMKQDVRPTQKYTHERERERDPEDWLALRNTIKREAEQRVLEVQQEYKEELDLWDTSMVAEYSAEIFAYMEELEVNSMPNPNYMEAQTEIEWPMRATLVDWLMQVHMRYHMLPETLWITINIVDRFLSNRIVSLVKLQLVGITAMFVAAKYEEIMAPSVDEFVYMTESSYTREEILKGERIILASLDFQISNYCSPYSWVRRISKADDYDIQTRTLSKFLMEVTLLDHRFLRAKPSMIAAVGMYLARRMLGGDWSEPFIFYSKYTEAQLATPTSFILTAISAADFEERFVYQKYSNKKFLKASIFARQWAKATLESATRAHELSLK